jgi:hypothetical protein
MYFALAISILIYFYTYIDYRHVENAAKGVLICIDLSYMYVLCNGMVSERM